MNTQRIFDCTRSCLGLLLAVFLLASGCEGDDGAAGAAGPPGADGISCWDLNENGIGDLPDEDINGDGVVDVLDCQTPPSAEIIPGVNTAFDSITEVATSATANGTYDAVSDYSYDAATETITLGGGLVPFGGLFVSITGDATLGGVTSSYTVYTFVASNEDVAAANELTSLAVGHVAEGTAGDFAAAVDLVAANTLGVDSTGITAPSTETDRDPAVRASMIAISNEFENAGFVPGTSSASTVNGAIAQCMALGGLVYDNWTKLNAGGTGLLPVAEPNGDYVRCKACHGWDALATDGGYARRSRTSSRPNAGYQDPNTVSRNISGGPVSLDMILHAGTGRSWAEGSAIFDTTDPTWGAGAQKGNEHPDLSLGGLNGTEVPSDTQITALVDFLNYPDARIDAVFSAVDPNPATVPAWCTSTQCTDYTLVGTADATRGDTWYHDPSGGNCVSCHGEPEDAVGPIATGPAGGLLVFLRQDGKFSEFRHKVQWGESGNDLMARANMNNPTAADVADVLAYLMTRIDDQVAGRPVANDDTASTEQDVAVDIDVLANDSDPTNDPLNVTAFEAASGNGGTVDCTVAGICTYTPPGGFTGEDTFDYTISDGVETATATVTVTVTSPTPVGDPIAGQTKYDAACSVCHAAGAHDTTTAAGANDLGGRGQELIDAGLLVNDLSTTNAAMNGITLTDQEILDLAAFLDTV